MALDIRTLVVVLGVTHLIQFVVFIHQYLVSRSILGVGWWLLWSVAEVLAFTFMLLRGIPSIQPTAIVVQNCLLISGVMFLYVGILRFFGQQEPRRRLVALYAVFVAGLCYFLYVHDEFNTRGALISATLATMAFLSGRALLLQKTRSVAASANLLAAVFIAHGCHFTYRLVVQLAGAPIGNFFAPTPFNGTAFLDAIIVGNLWTFGIVLMISQRLNAEMKDAKEEMELVFNTSPDAALISRLSDGLIVHLNDGFVALSGFTHAECLGKSTQAVHLWKDPADREAVVNELRSKGGCKNYEAVFQRKDGSELSGAMSAVVFNLQDIPHVISVTRDITERTLAEDALRESERRFRRAIIDAPFPILLHAEDGAIVLASQSWCDITGYTREELATIGDWTERAYGERRTFVQAEIDALYGLDHRKYEGDYTIRTKTGATRIWEFSSAPLGRLPDGRRLVMSMAMDVTERRAAEAAARQALAEVETSRTALLNVVEDQRRAEAEVRQLNAELEQRVADRTAQLEATNKELEAFSYSISHDLRAPLRGIDGWSLALLEDCGAQLDDQGRQHLDRVRAETQRMGQLIDDLLALSRVTRYELRSGPVDLSALAHRATARLREAAPGRPVELLIQSGLRTQGDAGLLEVALTNLLENAWKFTAQRPMARIELGRMEQEGARVFFVRDNGVGFAMAHAQKLFAPFQRVHRADEFPGTGIGLATVQRIIARHGGRIWAEAQMDHGATFYFTLERTE